MYWKGKNLTEVGGVYKSPGGDTLDEFESGFGLL